GQVLGEAKIVLQIQRLVVLIGLAGRLALRLAPAGWSAGDEGIQAVEAQRTAVTVVEETIDEGAAEFISVLPVVAAGGPGEIVEELPVGVGASAGNRGVGAKVSEARDADGRQSEILRTGTHVQADR